MSWVITPTFSIDIIQIGSTATSSTSGNFTFIRKTTPTSSSAQLLSYAGPAGNFTGGQSFNTPLITFTSGNMFLHPGDGSAAVGVRWQAPESRSIAISGRFAKDNTFGISNGVNVSVYKNNTTSVVSPVLIDATNSIYQYTDVVVSVAQNDVLDFLIDNNGSFTSDHTNCNILKIRYL